MRLIRIDNFSVITNLVTSKLESINWYRDEWYLQERVGRINMFTDQFWVIYFPLILFSSDKLIK